MQYSFVLPGDYDMGIIRERIATRGPLLDDLPGLLFKAYLHAAEPENTYAPFYLWRDEEAMHGFLNGPAFAGVARAFGWPSVQTWTPWHATMTDDVRAARFATCGSAVIAPYSVLSELRLREEALAQQALSRGALAVVIGFEPVTWTISRICLWRDDGASDRSGDAQQGGDGCGAGAGMAAVVWRRYLVGHVSAPAARS